jgi:hypothetical protein
MRSCSKQNGSQADSSVKCFHFNCAEVMVTSCCLLLTFLHPVREEEEQEETT